MKKLKYLELQYFKLTKMTHSISIISDTHGRINSNIIPYLKNTDMIIHAGDITSTKTIKDLKEYCDNVYVVAGNNDVPEFFNTDEDKNIISKLNKLERIKIDSHIITVTHGDTFGGEPSHDDLRKTFADSKLIVYGHTHRQVCDQNCEPWVINPGAGGYTRNRDGGACFMQIIINNDAWTIKPYCFT